jgi:hypothetical protein
MNIYERELLVLDRAISSLVGTDVISSVAADAAVVALVKSASFGAQQHTPSVKSRLD